MSKLIEIETALLQIDPASFQRLAEAYPYRRGYQHPHQTRIGTPRHVAAGEDQDGYRSESERRPSRSHPRT